jgi:hypothetical protein
MSEGGIATRPSTGVRPRTSARFERRLYLTASVGFLLLVLWTFARTYFLKFLYATPPLSALLHVHAVVMTGWVVLLAVQSTLISVRRVAWHRRLGVFGAGWAALLVIVGSVTTVHAAAREVRGHTPMAAPQVVITTLDLAQMVLFAAFVIIAIRQRRRVDIHKRLMLLTIACMLPDPLARLPVSFMTNELILAGLYGFVVLCVAADTLRHRRLHPALGWGGLIMLTTFTVLLFAAQTPAWITLGTRLLS